MTNPLRWVVASFVSAAIYLTASLIDAFVSDFNIPDALQRDLSTMCAVFVLGTLGWYLFDRGTKRILDGQAAARANLLEGQADLLAKAERRIDALTNMLVELRVQLPHRPSVDPEPTLDPYDKGWTDGAAGKPPRSLRPVNGQQGRH